MIFTVYFICEGRMYQCPLGLVVTWASGALLRVRAIPLQQNKGRVLSFRPRARLCHRTPRCECQTTECHRRSEPGSTSSGSYGAVLVGSFSPAVHYSWLRCSVSAALSTINPTVIYDQWGLLGLFYFFLNAAPALPSTAVCDRVPPPALFP